MSIRKPHNAPLHLYRGENTPCSTGEFLSPHAGRTVTGERGSFVYATPDIWLAAAYGFKTAAIKNKIKIGLYATQDDASPIVIIGMDSDKSSVGLNIHAGTTYIQTLSSAHFEGVFLQDRTAAQEPVEWVSRFPTKILKIESIPNAELLRSGVVQVFTTSKKVFKEINGFDPEAMGHLIRSSAVIWENMRPNYCDSTDARPPFLIQALGFEHFHVRRAMQAPKSDNERHMQRYCCMTKSAVKNHQP